MHGNNLSCRGDEVLQRLRLVIRTSQLLHELAQSPSFEVLIRDVPQDASNGVGDLRRGRSAQVLDERLLLLFQRTLPVVPGAIDFRAGLLEPLLLLLLGILLRPGENRVLFLFELFPLGRVGLGLPRGLVLFLLGLVPAVGDSLLALVDRVDDPAVEEVPQQPHEDQEVDDLRHPGEKIHAHH